MVNTKSTPVFLRSLQATILFLSILSTLRNFNSPKSFDLLATKIALSKGKNISNSFKPAVTSNPGLGSKTIKSSPKLSSKMTSNQMIFFILLIAGDIQTNPGPSAAVYPCGYCELPVTWSTAGICCDQCDMWYHKSCLGMTSAEFSELADTSTQWSCFKCGTTNLDSFTYHSFSSDKSSSFVTSATANATGNSIPSPPLNPLSPPSRCSTPKVPHHSSSVTPQKAPDISAASSDNSLLRSADTFGNLRILNINCQGIRNKISEFKSLLSYTKPDIVCGTESWLSKEVRSSEIFPSDYQVFRNDRDGIGGGVFILVKINLIAIEIENVSNCEIIWVKLKLKKAKELLISCFYMPHRDINILNEFEKSVQQVDQRGTRNIVICGDFNCPDINWEYGFTSNQASNKGVQDRLIDISVENSLSQLQEEPTRQNNILDLIFVTNPSLVKNITTIPGLSDHNAVIMDSFIKPCFTVTKKRKLYNFKKADWPSLETWCHNISNSIIEKSKLGYNIHQLWDLFKSTLKLGISQHVPSKFVKNRSSLPWINKHLERLVKKKTKLFRKAKSTGNWNEFKQHQKHCRKEFRKAEYEFVNNTINEGLANNNSKPFWRYIKSRKCDNIGVSPLKERGQLQSEAKKKAEILLQQFQSVFSKDTSNTMPDVKNIVKDSITSLKVDSKGTEKLLSDIKPHKACGPTKYQTSSLRTAPSN